MVVHVVVHVVADRYRVERRWSGASTRQWTSTRAGPPPPASLPALRGVPAPDVTPLALALVAPLPFRRFDTAAAAAVAATAAPCWSLVSAVEFSRVYVLCSSFTRTHDAGWVQKQSRRWSLALRPEHHPRSDQSGHVYRAANLQDSRTTLSEDPRTRSAARSAAGTFSGHRQRSRRICHQKCGCRVSPSTSGSLRSTRDRKDCGAYLSSYIPPVKPRSARHREGLQRNSYYIVNESAAQPSRS